MSFIVSFRPPRHYFLHFCIFFVIVSNHVIYLCGKIHTKYNTKYKLEHGSRVDLI